MNEFSDPMDDLLDCECKNCKGHFWVPYYEDMIVISFPAFCCFCGHEFGGYEEVG